MHEAVGKNANPVTASLKVVLRSWFNTREELAPPLYLGLRKRFSSFAIFCGFLKQAQAPVPAA